VLASQIQRSDAEDDCRAGNPASTEIEGIDDEPKLVRLLLV
jgi:hypothetical protein